ncbi:trypco2 family protein [Streptomyces sp. DG1A-41]|uniref:trypco2 family protein n=1 Tax=Streptomyces sp. DG1A-41 TaxID=3125779 RepID=UPI0030D13A33
MVSEPWAELSEAVGAIRAQLQQAMEEGAGNALAFRAGPVELEFSVEVRKEAGATAKVFVLPWSAGPVVRQAPAWSPDQTHAAAGR